MILLFLGGFNLLTNVLSNSFIKGILKLSKINSNYYRCEGGVMQVTWGFMGIGVYKKGHIVKIRDI
jgi:hypothetical protein